MTDILVSPAISRGLETSTVLILYFTGAISVKMFIHNCSCLLTSDHAQRIRRTNESVIGVMRVPFMVLTWS